MLCFLNSSGQQITGCDHVWFLLRRSFVEIMVLSCQCEDIHIFFGEPHGRRRERARSVDAGLAADDTQLAAPSLWPRPPLASKEKKKNEQTQLKFQTVAVTAVLRCNEHQICGVLFLFCLFVFFKSHCC